MHGKHGHACTCVVIIIIFLLALTCCCCCCHCCFHQRVCGCHGDDCGGDVACVGVGGVGGGGLLLERGCPLVYRPNAMTPSFDLSSTRDDANARCCLSVVP